MKISESEMVEGFRHYGDYARNAGLISETREFLFGRLASLYIGQGCQEEAVEMLMRLEGQTRQCLAALQKLRQMVEALEGE